MVAQDDRERFAAFGIAAADFGGPRSGVDLPNDLPQRFERDRIGGVFLGQVQELLRDFIALLVDLGNKLHPLRVGQNLVATRCAVVFLAQCLELLGGSRGFLLRKAIQFCL